MDYIIQALRFFFASLDEAAIWLIELAYDLLIKLADTNIFGDVLGVFAKRIYVLLAIFMMFKMALSLINYLISPDDFYAKDKGFSKLIINTMVAIILLVSVEYIFNAAFKVQGEIIENNIIPKLILGTEGSAQLEREIEERPGKDVTFAIYSAFIKPDKKNINSDACDNIYALPSNGVDNTVSNCINAIPGLSVKGIDNLEAAVRNRDAKNLLDLLPEKNSNGLIFEYPLVITSLVGVFVAFIFISFCFDISLRAIKLGFLQLIAPIPIISYIDPKSGKDGLFKKWYKMCFETYFDLFVRLIAVFFAIFVISLFTLTEFRSYSTGDVITWQNPLLKIFIILGALTFAKELPKLITDLTGFKSEGKFTVNPLRKLNATPFAGKTLSTLGGAFAGGIAGHRVGNILGGALLGAGKGFGTTPFMGTKDGKNAFNEGANNAYKSLMGKDFIRFEPTKMMLAGESHIKEVGDPLKEAYSRLNALKTKLNIASNNSVLEAEKLQKNGIDLNKLDDTKKSLLQRHDGQSAMTAKAKSAYEGIASKLGEMTDDYNSAQKAIKSGLINPSSPAYQSYQSIIKNYENLQQESNRLETEYNHALNDEKQISDVLNTIDAYEQVTKAETELRGQVSKMEKDIKDLSSEKSQRERFYNYDPAPTKDVNKLIKDYQQKKETTDSNK